MSSHALTHSIRNFFCKKNPFILFWPHELGGMCSIVNYKWAVHPTLSTFFSPKYNFNVLFFFFLKSNNEWVSQYRSLQYGVSIMLAEEFGFLLHLKGLTFLDIYNIKFSKKSSKKNLGIFNAYGNLQFS